MADKKAKGGGKKTIEQTYQRKTPLEHVLLRPDTYIGSVESITEEQWVYDEGLGMNHRIITYVPGLYKIFDEILVNAADNYQRDNSMTEIRVELNREAGEITVWNNGEGIPIHFLLTATVLTCISLKAFLSRFTPRRRCTCQSSSLVTC